jgi:Transposase DDE domain
LTYWRRRLAASDRPNRIFEAVHAVVAQTGASAGKTRRALDSTVLDDAVATKDTVTQLIGAVRRVGGEVSGAGAVIEACCTGHDYGQPGKPQIAWDDEAMRADLVNALVGDAHRLLQQPARAASGFAGCRGGGAVGAGGRPGRGTGRGLRWHRWALVHRPPRRPDRVISTVDPDTRHAHKSWSRRQDGFKAHLAVEPDTGIITDCALTRATGADNHEPAVGLQLLGGEQEPVTMLADSAYGTGQFRAELAERGHIARVKPAPVPGVIPGGFTVDDFTVDHAKRTAT